MKKQRNETFVILSAFGILMILLGHLDFQILTMGNLFPYYSFHVMLFIFISGYFYKADEEKHIFSYIKRKFLHLMIPYFIWNVVYGILATILHNAGMSIGEPVSLYNLFVAPFLHGHQFMYQASSWFVPALFLVEFFNIIGRKILSFLKIRNEYIILLLYLSIGLVAVFLSKRGSVYDYYRIPGRIMFLAPCFQLGHLYKEKLESKDTLPSSLYFAILFILQFILVWINEGRIVFSAAWVNGFANSIFLPYLTTITGIALWLRIAKILTPMLKQNRFISYLGTHTFSVMMHHLTGFLLLNFIFSKLSNVSEYFSGFDYSQFTSDIYYVFLPLYMQEWKWIYLIIGLAFPLFLSHLGEKLFKRSH